MKNDKKTPKIEIVEDGPYIVSGNVNLSEKIITPKGIGYEYKDGRQFPQSEEYKLCRCGKSKDAPFCDDSHEKVGFKGTETASKAKYIDRAEVFEGPGLDLMDDHRCALARFCHTEEGNTWDLLEVSDDPKYREAVIKGASECPTGRLVALDKTGKAFEPEYEPSIEILQDPENGASAGISVKGNIPIVSSDGETYEIRNRVVLCRCGQSNNKPFCDIGHIHTTFSDK
ncbi:CDGSH iron-sulfur domain-containing protein [Acetobacterium sp.]|uniref:CDGSH iron-sulfur domain-containing protein n=1 Tax=Acetobacterium sp. TaxID=1872094 RepID=UPI002F41AEE9